MGYLNRLPPIKRPNFFSNTDGAEKILKQLSGKIIFEDDSIFENSVYKQQCSCYQLDYWQGILTYYPLKSTELDLPELLYRGKRMAFFI